MRTVFKYQLPFAEKASVKRPRGAEIIRCAGLDSFLWCWAIVDTDAPIESREFLLFKTGAPMPADKKLRFLGCGAIFIQMELMLYIFEEVKPTPDYQRGQE